MMDQRDLARYDRRNAAAKAVGHDSYAAQRAARAASGPTAAETDREMFVLREVDAARAAGGAEAVEQALRARMSTIVGPEGQTYGW